MKLLLRLVALGALAVALFLGVGCARDGSKGVNSGKDIPKPPAKTS
jgi:hypothetical protein